MSACCCCAAAAVHRDAGRWRVQCLRHACSQSQRACPRPLPLPPCTCHAGQRVLSADSGLATVGGAAVYGVVRAAQVRLGMTRIAPNPKPPAFRLQNSCRHLLADVCNHRTSSATGFCSSKSPLTGTLPSLPGPRPSLRSSRPAFTRCASTPWSRGTAVRAAAAGHAVHAARGSVAGTQWMVR